MSKRMSSLPWCNIGERVAGLDAIGPKTVASSATDLAHRHCAGDAPSAACSLTTGSASLHSGSPLALHVVCSVVAFVWVCVSVCACICVLCLASQFGSVVASWLKRYGPIAYHNRYNRLLIMSTLAVAKCFEWFVARRCANDCRRCTAVGWRAGDRTSGKRVTAESFGGTKGAQLGRLAGRRVLEASRWMTRRTCRSCSWHDHSTIQAMCTFEPGVMSA